MSGSSRSSAALALDLRAGSNRGPVSTGAIHRLAVSWPSEAPVWVIHDGSEPDSAAIAGRSALEATRHPVRWIADPGDMDGIPRRPGSPEALELRRTAPPDPTRGPWAARVGLAELTPEPPAWSEGAEIFVVDGSLLDVSRWEALRPAGSVGAPTLVVTDPFADGRLSGRALRNGALEGPSAGPTRVRELEEWVRAIQPFGFLALAGRRTLAQAALLYLLGHPRVAAVAVPVFPPEVLDEIVRLGGVPPLSPTDRERLEVLAGRAEPGPGTPRGAEGA